MKTFLGFVIGIFAGWLGATALTLYTIKDDDKYRERIIKVAENSFN